MAAIENYWKYFVPFCAAELSTGGPDPQVAMMAHLSRGLDPVERVWLIGCYGAHHCVPSAHAVWSKWRPQAVLDKQDEFSDWLKEHWDALPVRPEMRSHRMLYKRHECLSDFADFAIRKTWEKGDYLEVWNDSIDSVKYYSRYMAIKILEMMRRTVRPDLSMPDLRAKGAWSPRRMLALLFPEEPVLDERENQSKEALQLVNEYAVKAQKRLAENGVLVNLFQLQVMLCETREYLNGGYSAGGSLYEEILYMDIASKKFDQTAIYAARKEIFPPEYLGELTGWDKNLKKLMPKIAEDSL